jgi:hypothetical protein
MDLNTTNQITSIGNITMVGIPQCSYIKFETLNLKLGVCLDCCRWLPFQKFGVDREHKAAFGLKPSSTSHTKISVASSDFRPARGRNRGGQIPRQNIGAPEIWRGGRGQTAPRPSCVS